jgi:hypothetical protein
MHRSERLDGHQKFKELAAIAQGRGLSGAERMELDRHLQMCDACRSISDEYSLLCTEGMAFLASACGHVPESETWDNRNARNQLLSRVQESERSGPRFAVATDARPVRRFWVWGDSHWGASQGWAAAAVAACLVVGIAAGAYQLGGRMHTPRQLNAAVAPAHLPEAVSDKKAEEDLLASQAARISQLQKQISGEQRDLAGLRAALRAAEDRSGQLATANSKGEGQLRQVTEQRDKLAGQLHDAEKEYQLLQVELTTLRAEHDHALLHMASLESKVEELSAAARDQDRRLKDDQQYLASDRDIRELMGARKLYIADVFDVDSGSRTRKPFGRVFYTQNKSLIFYAFDLEQQPGVKNASAFQVWGQRDGEVGEKSHPMNLGILYMDSETNRRWVLRWDDPKQLAEIDAVFVTVEPHGGSQKPTGKPFLYALLRKEANHP